MQATGKTALGGCGVGSWVLVAAAMLCATSSHGAQLTIDDGVVVKFGTDAELVVRDQVVVGKGTAFTSQKDDQLGGRTSAEPQTPAKGDWRGIRVEKSASPFGFSLVDGTVRFAGANNSPALSVRGFTPVLQSMEIVDSAVGLRLTDAGSPAITASSFARNGVGLEVFDSTPTVSSSQFLLSAEHGVLNQTPTSVVQATGNWWGSSSGPRHPDAGPNVTGDRISAGVTFNNFLGSAALLSPSVRLTAPSPYFEERTVSLDVHCINATDYRVSESGVFTGVAFQPLVDGRATAPFELSAGSGQKNISVQFRSSTGATVTATLQGGVLIDTEPPVVSITNPAQGSIVGGPVSIDATASDGSGIAQVQFYVNGELRSTDTTAPYAYAWDNSAATEGVYELRVVATDQATRSSETMHSVTLTRAPTPPDSQGPALTDLKFNGAALADNATISQSGTITVKATDPSGVTRVELLVDGELVATASGSGTYTVALSIDQLANGTHTIALRAIDSLSNQASISRSVVVSHAVPTAPVLTQPANNSTTREASVTVGGTAQAGRTIQLHLSGQPVGSPVVAGADGRFSAILGLNQGLNSIRATAQDQWGVSPMSAELKVMVDSSIPAPPSGLVALSQPAGKIRLTWTRPSDAKVVGFNIYRAPSPFSAIAEAVKINGPAVTTNVFDDTPTSDGTYYYRVVSVNAVATPSDPSNAVEAIADSVPPKASSIVYTTQGKVDPQTGNFGQGLVSVAVTVSEPLQSIPYLSVVPQGGTPIPVQLAKTGTTAYAGSFLIDSQTGSGTANALFSARDGVGNRGTAIQAGATLGIDTAGPALVGISLSPAAPIRYDNAPVIDGVFTLSKTMRSGSVPQLSYKLSGASRSTVNVTGVVQSNPTTWIASFTLPADAGTPSPESFSFAFQGVDALDNYSSRITAPNRFQVYQGELPPADVPIGFAATAQPGGKVKLSWVAVEEAVAYQLYRQAPGESALAPYLRATGELYIDQTSVDGMHRYALASIRQSNGQESLSEMTPAVEVVASATAPGAPQNLTLQLIGQGIQATWQPPLASTVDNYRLYRSSGSSITSVEGLAPLKSGIRTTTAIDANPSTTDHAYVVTALDAAGNESAPSNSEYLNASLLPVSSLRVEQSGSALPVISWTASKTTVAGYKVYVGPEASRTELTSGPISGLSLTDSGYDGGARIYTVAAVDSEGVELPRTVVFPSLDFALAAGTPIQRGVMNRLQVQVTNTSSASVADARVVAKLAGREHRSETFSLSAQETRLIPVVVGGYTDLQGQVSLDLAVEIVPHEGELVRVSRTKTADVTDGALVVGMATEDFVRGGTGKVRLTIENTSEVEVELLTARSNGTIASNELRFKILDADGNVLASQAYQQAFGANVVTLASGQTVARIPPGASYTSDPFYLNVPAASPTNIGVRLEVDKLRYHTGQADEITIAGRGSEKSVVLSDTAYVGEVTDVTPISSFGDQDIVIAGRALVRNADQPLPNTRLKLVLNQQGFERVFSVLTDASGGFVYVFKPTVTDAGLFRVSAVHPDITDRPEQKSFTINRVTVGPTPYKIDIPRNYPFSIPFTAKAGPGTSASNLRFVIDPVAQPTGQVPTGISIVLPAPVTLVERQTLNVPVRFTANNSSPPVGSVILNVVSDESPVQPIGVVRIDYKLSEAKPFLVSVPTHVETGLAQGGSQLESVVVTNKGLQDAVNLRFSLATPAGAPAPDWVAITSSGDGTLPIGATRSVDLAFTPPASLAEGVYEFRLVVVGDNVPQQSLNVYASVTQSGQGNVLFKASDIYTATFDKNGQLILGLAGAVVTLQNEDVVTVTHELVTDSVGEALFQNVPAGNYKFRVKASNHQEIGGRLQVKPGVTLNQPVFLEYNLINVEWSVREITIQDRYEITLNATFETDVPAAVVVIQPSSINLPKMKVGDVFYGELALTNHGLIRADNVKQRLPRSDGFFRYEFLTEVPSSLAAKERVTLPYRVIALQALDPSEDGSASGGGCYNYSNDTAVTCDFVCANGATSSCGSSASWFSGSNSSCPAGGGGGSSGGGGSVGDAGGFGGPLGGSPAGQSIRLKGKKCVHIPRSESLACE